MHLTSICRVITTWPSTGGIFRSRHQPLLVVGKALRAIEIHWPLMWMHECGEVKARVQCSSHEFRAGHDCAVCHLQAYLLTVALQDLRQRGQLYDDVGMYPRPFSGCARHPC